MRVRGRARNLVPGKWQTERLNVADSVLDEAQVLQEINDAVPQTQGWMRVEGRDEAECSMHSAIVEGVLPPIESMSKEFFRLQSIRLADTDELIGFLAMYHGFPTEDIFWINAVTFLRDYRARGTERNC